MSRHRPAVSAPDRSDHVPPGKETNAATTLADDVDVVVGVDTHEHTHTAAVATATGGRLDGITVDADPGGDAALLAFAERFPGRRAWAVEGTGSFGAGLTRCLRERGERVVELDRPRRPARRNGAKSDELDALRAAREALGREHLAEPEAGAERDALAALLAARRPPSTPRRPPGAGSRTSSPPLPRSCGPGCGASAPPGW